VNERMNVDFWINVIRNVCTEKDKINYLLTYDSYGPVYNKFHRGEWITPGPLNGNERSECHLGAGVSRAPSPPTGPSNPFAPMKSIIHRAIRISGQ
jgi:hypothetical protein